MAIGTGNLPYPMSPVSPFDVITSQAENERIANIESLADGTGIGDGAIPAPKIYFDTFSKRRNNGVDGSAQNMHIAGWAGAMATAANSISISVTFGVTFTEPPIVTAVYGGDKASGAVSWPVGVAVKRGYVVAHSITTTGFTVTIYSSDASNWSTANSVYAQWSAFGSVA